MKGTVKWFSRKKGYGFITGEDGQDYFVHYSSIVDEGKYRSLDAEQEVLFTPAQSEKGLEAHDVRSL